MHLLDLNQVDQDLEQRVMIGLTVIWCITGMRYAILLTMLNSIGSPLIKVQTRIYPA